MAWNQNLCLVNQTSSVTRCEMPQKPMTGELIDTTRELLLPLCSTDMVQRSFLNIYVGSCRWMQLSALTKTSLLHWTVLDAEIYMVDPRVTAAWGAEDKWRFSALNRTFRPPTLPSWNVTGSIAEEKKKVIMAQLYKHSLTTAVVACTKLGMSTGIVDWEGDHRTLCPAELVVAEGFWGEDRHCLRLCTYGWAYQAPMDSSKPIAT